jgi:glucan phosphoethanolaminetransferase (alkaline phosphatase superfamily)
MLRVHYFWTMTPKTIHLTLSIVFLLFALVQYNDPDPLLWMLIYGVVALVALLKVYLRQVNFRPLITTLIIILSMYALFYIPVFIDFIGNPDKEDLLGKMKVTKPWIEGTREFLGLLIAVGALFYLRKPNAR